MPTEAFINGFFVVFFWFGRCGRIFTLENEEVVRKNREYSSLHQLLGILTMSSSHRSFRSKLLINSAHNRFKVFSCLAGPRLYVYHFSTFTSTYRLVNEISLVDLPTHTSLLGRPSNTHIITTKHVDSEQGGGGRVIIHPVCALDQLRPERQSSRFTTWQESPSGKIPPLPRPPPHVSFG